MFKLKFPLFNLLLTLCCLHLSLTLLSQVALRDTVVLWQHHEFDLNPNYSISSFSTTDTDIEEVAFIEAKVIENDLIRLVLLPEYGGRVLSF